MGEYITVDLPFCGSTVSGQPEHVTRAVAIDRDFASQERRWVADLRRCGVKAAHPDDGWVNRDENKIHLCYPQFNDGLGVGDLLALGSPRSETRIVKILDSSENRFALEPGPWYWHFVAV